MEIDSCIYENAYTSAVECFLFHNEQPAKYFAYVNGAKRELTTWTGEKLATITDFGDSYRDNFGGKRRSLRVRTATGTRYSGTYYESAGDYARLRKIK